MNKYTSEIPISITEPRHDKTNNVAVRPVKTRCEVVWVSAMVLGSDCLMTGTYPFCGPSLLIFCAIHCCPVLIPVLFVCFPY